MYILSFKTGHDPAACLLEDGRIIAATEEERFVRVKHAADYFPEKAIRYCLSVRSLKLDDVDYIVFARAKNLATLFKVAFYFISRPPRNLTEARYAVSLLKVQLKGVAAAAIGRAPYQKIFKIIGGRKRRIYPPTFKGFMLAFLQKIGDSLPVWENIIGIWKGGGVYSFDHHLCHASSAYYGSGFGEAAILCMDGKGEATSISMWYGKDSQIHSVRRYGIFSSLGYLYGSITDFLGFWINDGEYKIMGLAPYGESTYPMNDVFTVGESGVWVNTRYSMYPFSLANLKKRFVGVTKDYSESAPPQPNTDIAATLQDRLEKAALRYVKKLLQATSNKRQATRNLCLAGGVALNVKMNKVIWESGLIEKLWIQPAAGDMGNVLGAAWLLYYKKFKIRPGELEQLYLGPEYNNEEIEKALESSGFNYKKSEDISKETADLLVGGKIIAWFQGRMEFGPRALGGRSVLADPRTAGMKEVINAKVKFREPFRPFCPSFLEGHADDFIKNYMPSPYMVLSFAVKDGWENKIPAVVHVDGTIRPQEVFESTNPAYYKMIKYFYEKTGVPVVLNTSLNIKGEPIVNTPEEAIVFFKKTDVDYLVVGNYLVGK